MIVNIIDLAVHIEVQKDCPRDPIEEISTFFHGHD